MAIQDRNLTPGTRLLARYRKQQYSCEVVVRDGGKLGYRLEDGREFKSPSAAGTAITGKACNGWAFWSVETSTAPVEPEAESADAAQEPVVPPAEDSEAAHEEATEKEEVEEPEPETAPATPTSVLPSARRRFSRVPNQRGVPEGQTRWHCYDCGKSFLAPTDQTPEACPLPHPAA